MKDPSLWVYEENKHDPKRHEEERAKNGFSTYDWWNFSDYLAWVNIQGLEKFKEGMGFPSDLNSMDEWREELQIMIDGFEAYNRMQNEWYSDTASDDPVTYEKGMALYAKRFSTLWD